MNNKLSIIKKILLFVLFYLALFQNPLEGIKGGFANIDEALCAAILVCALVKVILSRKVELDRRRINIIISIVFLIAIGVAGNIIYKYQLTKYAMKDAILMFKGLIVYISLPILTSDFNIDDYMESLNKQLKIITVVVFLMVISNIFLKYMPGDEVRFGIETQKLFFSHPTYLASFGILVISILSIFMKNHKENWKYILMMSIVVCTTGRAKVIAFLAIYIYLYFIIIFKNRKLNKVDFIILSVLGIAFAIEQVMTYLSHIYWARSAVTIGSMQVAYDHFPLGTGFGTFANWVSGENYSPLYFKYGFEVVPGLRPDFYDFIADTFWPMLLGQFGLGGVLIFVFIIVNIYLNIKDNDDIYNYFGQMSLLFYLIILSLAEASFSGPISVLYFAIITVLSRKKLKVK